MISNRDNGLVPSIHRIIPVRAGVVVVCLLLVGSLASCSDKTSDSSGNAESVESPKSGAEVDHAGSGEIESVAGGWGTRMNPVPANLVEEAIGHEGTRELRTASVNLCRSLDPSITAHEFTNHNVRAVYYDVAYGSGTATLVCSAPQPAIWKLTTGPGGDGVSVPCPAHKSKAVANTGAAYFGYTDDGTSASSVIQSSGGRGYNNDGLWNYWFHNWNTRDVIPTMWLLCG